MRSVLLSLLLHQSVLSLAGSDAREVNSCQGNAFSRSNRAKEVVPPPPPLLLLLKDTRDRPVYGAICETGEGDQN
ncbi:hypothetical protein QLX08_000717 [Tetragonisca angustula]|uniref:Secreted protein n=1 Tax=Tetragonisca angustula TaxID=166442 RepID=A0AAW1AIK1_9HYME